MLQFFRLVFLSQSFYILQLQAAKQEEIPVEPVPEPASTSDADSEPKEGQSSDQHVGPCTVMFIDLGELYLLFLFLFHNNIVTS